MGNELDEITGPTNSAGRDINVVDKQLKIEVGFGTKLFEIAIWVGVGRSRPGIRWSKGAAKKCVVVIKVGAVVGV